MEPWRPEPSAFILSSHAQRGVSQHDPACDAPPFETQCFALLLWTRGILGLD